MNDICHLETRYYAPSPSSTCHFHNSPVRTCIVPTRGLGKWGDMACPRSHGQLAELGLESSTICHRRQGGARSSQGPRCNAGSLPCDGKGLRAKASLRSAFINGRNLSGGLAQVGWARWCQGPPGRCRCKHSRDREPKALLQPLAGLAGPH